MNPDHAVDDELEAGQPDTVVRNVRKIKSPVRVANIHHDLDVHIGQLVDLNLLLFEVMLE